MKIDTQHRKIDQYCCNFELKSYCANIAESMSRHALQRDGVTCFTVPFTTSAFEGICNHEQLLSLGIVDAFTDDIITACWKFPLIFS